MWSEEPKFNPNDNKNRSHWSERQGNVLSFTVNKVSLASWDTTRPEIEFCWHRTVLGLKIDAMLLSSVMFFFVVCLFHWFFALMLSASSNRELNIILQEKCAHRRNLLLNSCLRLLNIFRSNSWMKAIYWVCEYIIIQCFLSLLINMYSTYTLNKICYKYRVYHRGNTKIKTFFVSLWLTVIFLNHLQPKT